MNDWRTRSIILALVASLAVVACGDDDEDNGDNNQTNNNQVDPVEPFDDDCTTTLQPMEDSEATTDAIDAALLEVQSGDVVCLVDGDYEMTRGVSLTVDDVEIRGESQQGVVLDFSEQSGGSSGIDVENADNFTIRHLSVHNTAGDGIQVRNGDGVHFDGIDVIWDSESDSNNGDYGLYPVMSQNIIIENSYVFGASDAGIYLGQSEDGIIRGNVVEGNVAGLEVENSSRIDVYDNVATDNSAGILIFNLPELERKEGDTVRAFDNQVTDNNRANFSGESAGIISLVPAGSGFLIVGVQDVRVYDNEIIDHKSIGVGAVSFDSLPQSYEDDEYNPNAELIDVFDNVIDEAGYDPEALAAQLIDFEPIPHVVWDGVFDDEVDLEDRQNCFSGNVDSDGEPATYGNMATESMELDDVDCSLDELPAVEL